MGVDKRKLVFNPLTGKFDITQDVSTLVEADDLVAYQKISFLGQPDGYASLDSGGKVPVSQLPSSVMQYQGQYNASTDTPSLSNGTGDAGDVYEVVVAGSNDFGAGSISFNAGDWVVYNGTIWQKSINSNEVVSVNGLTGAVNLDTDDIAEGLNLYYTAARFNTAFSAKSTDDLTEGVTNLYYTNARAKAATVADLISDGVTDVAPSQNAVFDALALKADTNLGNLIGPTAINANLNADSFTVGSSRSIGDLVPFNRVGALRYSNPGIVYAMTGDFTLGSNQITNVTGTLPTFQTTAYYSVYVQGVTGFNTITTFNSATLLTMSANALANSVGATFYLVAPYLARSEDVAVAGQQSGLFGVRSGNVTTGLSGTMSITSGNATGAAGVSGLSILSSGTTTTGNSGAVIVRSGASSSGGASGNVSSTSGTVTTGTSGSQSLFTGNATGAAGISGGIAINTGTTTTGNTGEINIITGGSTSGTTGNLNLGTGNTAGTKGVINAFTHINMNSSKINSLSDPAAPQDAATKNYVDTAVSALTAVKVMAHNSSGQSIAISTATTVTNWTTLTANAAFNATTGIFTAPVAGFYEFDATITFVDSFGNGDRVLNIIDITNTVNYAESLKPFTTAASGQTTLCAKAIINCTAGMQVAIRVLQTSTGAQSIATVGARNTLMIKQLL